LPRAPETIDPSLYIISLQFQLSPLARNHWTYRIPSPVDCVGRCSVFTGLAVTGQSWRENKTSDTYSKPGRELRQFFFAVFFLCLRQAAQYLTDVYQPASNVVSRRDLRSAGRRLLEVPRYRRGTFARRAFAVAGPSVWNSLPEGVGRDTFKKHWVKDVFYSHFTNTHSALEVSR